MRPSRTHRTTRTPLFSAVILSATLCVASVAAAQADSAAGNHPDPRLSLRPGYMDAAEAAHGKAIHIVNPKPKEPAPAGR